MEQGLYGDGDEGGSEQVDGTPEWLVMLVVAEVQGWCPIAGGC